MTLLPARLRSAAGATLLTVMMAAPCSASAIIPTFVDVDDPARAVVEAAIGLWETLLPDPFVFHLTIDREFLGGTLAFSSDFLEAGGLPSAATITFDDGTGVPWFIDATPEDDEEFRRGDDAFHGVARGGAAASGFDLLTVLQHELAHALGFSIFYPAFAAHLVDTPDGNRAYEGATATARLTGLGGGTHTLPEVHPFELMNPEMLPGDRLYPGPLTLAVLHDAFGYSTAPPRPIQSVPEVPVSVLVALSAWAVSRFR